MTSNLASRSLRHLESVGGCSIQQALSSSCISYWKLIAKTDVIIKACVFHWVFVNKHEMHIPSLSDAAIQLSRLRQLTALQALGKVLLLYAS